MEIIKELEWDMWHRILNHDSKCRNLHWHRYKIHITLEGEIIDVSGNSSDGMLIDFWDIKKIANSVIQEELDHGYMGQEWDPILEVAKRLWLKTIEVPFVPTAENIAHWLFGKFEAMYQDTFHTNLKLKKITLFETPTSYVVCQK